MNDQEMHFFFLKFFRNMNTKREVNFFSVFKKDAIFKYNDETKPSDRTGHKF